MSKADKMFEELGFIKKESPDYDPNHITYEKYMTADISFIEFRDESFVYSSLLFSPMKIYGELLKAIYEKMKELGWLE